MKNKASEVEVLKRLKELSKEKNKHNNFYHNLDNPKISDIEFDNLVLENNKLEKKYPHLILKRSPNKVVGAEVKSKFEKIRHISQMFSLGNGFNKKDLIDFIKRTNK